MTLYCCEGYKGTGYLLLPLTSHSIKSLSLYLPLYLPKTEKKEHTVIRFDDWLRSLDNLEEHYRPIAELMILTGMILSEMAGLKKEDIESEYLNLNKSYVLGEEKKCMKTACAIRFYWTGFPVLTGQ